MAALVLALVAALPAQAVELTWRGDPRCPQAGFQDSLARYLAGAAESRPVRVTVDVRREGEGRWSAALELEAAEGRSKRTLRGRSCAEIGDAAAFVTAVVVDPGVLSRPADGAIVPAAPVTEAGDADMPSGTGASGPAPRDMSSGADAGEAAPGASDLSSGTYAGDAAAGEVFSATSTTPGASALSPGAAAAAGGAEEPVAEDVRADRSRRTARPRGFVRIAGGLEALGTPRVGPTFGLAGGLLGRRWRVEITGLYRAPTTEYTQVDPQAGAKVRLWTVGARGCGVPRAGRVEFPLCGGLEAGQAIGAGVGFPGGRTDRIAWLAVVFGPAVAWAPRPWLALWFGVDLGVPLLGGTFGAVGLGPMFRIAPVSLRAALGLEFRFGR